MSESPFLRTVGEIQRTKYPPSQWVVEGLLRCGRRRISLLNSAPKTGKSTLSRQLAVSVAKGRSFLGRQCSRAPVLYWQTEDAPEDLQESFNRLRYDATADEPIYTFKGAANFNTLENFGATLATHQEIKLVIIETLDDLLRVQDLLSNTDAREAFEKFDEAFGPHAGHVACLALHHLKKNENKTDHGKDILGATVLRGRTDAEWFLDLYDDGSTTKKRLFEARIRRGREIELSFLDFDPEREFSTLGDTFAAYKAGSADRTNERLEAEILQYFAQNPGASFEENCFPLIAGNTKQKRTALRRLVARGQLVKTGKGVKGSRAGYAVVEIPADIQKQLGEFVQ